MFPLEFDLNCYIESNRDIDFEKIDDPLLHWQSIGRHVGRSANKIKNRFDFINLIDSELKILEIGPFVNPIIRGANIKYADVLNRNELIARAQKGGRAFDDVPEINYVLKNLDIGAIEDKFNYIISSHCIEHQPDLIGHLQGVNSILEDGGYYFLVIPDKRFCFDRYLPLTLVPDIIDAYYSKKKLHGLREVILHRAYTTHNDPIIHWNEFIENSEIYFKKPDPVKVHKITPAVNEWISSKGEYIDVHSLYFTPDSFDLIIRTLKDMGYINLSVERLYFTNRNSIEFYVILKKQ